VWDENWDIAMMFIRVQTQWNVSDGAYRGLRYECLEWLCKVYEITDQRAMLEGLRVMEAAALKALNTALSASG
jgi:hypothetical protein